VKPDRELNDEEKSVLAELMENAPPGTRALDVYKMFEEIMKDRWDEESRENPQTAYGVKILK